jgi:membrane associated rhomboid family serine protease
MMVASYRLGQKHYPIPYAWKKLCAYVVICILLFLLHQLFRKFSPSVWWTHLFGFLLLTAFVIFILKIEKKEFQKLPFIGKFIR